MDPDANLKEQLDLVDSINEVIDGADDDGTISDEGKESIIDDAQRLVELVDSLHGWIRRGGALPREWSRGR